MILVDNGSTDGSSQLCDEYGKLDKRIQVIHKEHGGVTSARRAGLDFAQGKYISFIDSDDWLDPDFYCLFDEFPQIDVDMILLTGYYVEWRGTSKVSTGLEEGYFEGGGLREILKKGVIPCVWLKIFKREILVKNMPLLDLRVWMGEDMLISHACLFDANIILIKKNCSYHYVQRQASAAHYYSYRNNSYRNIKNLYYFSKNVKKIQQQKKADFFNERWNQQILDMLMDIIIHEFKEQQIFLTKTGLRKIKEKFKLLKISSILIGKDSKKGFMQLEKKKRVVFTLYDKEFYRFLNAYLKLLEIFEKDKLAYYFQIVKNYINKNGK